MKNTTAHWWLTGNGPVEKEKSRMPERKRGISEPSPWQGGREWASGTGGGAGLGGRGQAVCAGTDGAWGDEYAFISCYFSTGSWQSGARSACGLARVLGAGV